MAPACHHQPFERLAATTPTEGTMRRGVGTSGAAGSDALFSSKKTRIELTWLDWGFSAINIFHKRVIASIQSIENVRRELLRAQRLTDGSECVRESLDFVEEGSNGNLMLLLFT